MKKHFNQPAVLLLALILFLGSCSKSSVDRVTTTPSAITPAELTTALTTGSWKLSSFNQKTEDKTSKFADVAFFLLIEQ